MYDILNRINDPGDISKLNEKELETLAEEIRAFLIDSVSKTGGHLASNLGVVELTLALARVFDLPKDKIVWDVGHQSYVYKLLTGRRDKFSTLRSFGGIAGFPKTNESVFDCFNTGHSSTSISAALGLKRASILNGKDERVIAVIGDGALSGGMALEALSDAGSLKENFIVILNDNNMSISQSVGGFTKHLTRLRSAAAYLTFKSRLERVLSRFTAGRRIVLFLKHIKDMVRHLLIGKTVFDDMGYTYFGPIDGHDLDTLTRMLQRAKNVRGPVLFHVITTKGKGYKFAEEEPALYHGVSTFEAAKGVLSDPQKQTYSGTAGKLLCELGETNDDLCVVTAAMAAGTGMDAFAERFPHKFYDVGIAEQHAVTLAAGLSAGGMRPFVVIYSSFLQRAYDQILHDVCLQNLNVVFLIDRAGIVGEDGETHHGLFDLSYMSAMPNMTVLAPANFDELEQMITYAADGSHQGPIAIRYPRGTQQSQTLPASPFVLGESLELARGTDVCLVCTGTCLATGEEVARILQEHDVSASVINIRTAFPLNEAYIKDLAERHKLLVSIEDGATTGGIGEHIASVLAKASVPCPLLIKGFPPVVTHGSPNELKVLCRMDASSVAEEIVEKLNG